MDNTDQQILEKLEKDARTPFLTIAKELKVSEGTIRKRVARMKEEGMIQKFTIKRDRDATAVVGIVTNPHVRTSDIVTKLKKMHTRTIYEVTGRYDLICTIHAENLEKANDLLEQIRTTQGIEQTETFTILKEN